MGQQSPTIITDQYSTMRVEDESQIKRGYKVFSDGQEGDLFNTFTSL